MDFDKSSIDILRYKILPYCGRTSSIRFAIVNKKMFKLLKHEIICIFGEQCGYCQKDHIMNYRCIECRTNICAYCHYHRVARMMTNYCDECSSDCSVSLQSDRYLNQFQYFRYNK